MRWFSLAHNLILIAVAIIGCGAPAPSATATAQLAPGASTPSAAGAQPAAKAPGGATSGGPGVRLFLDGKAVELDGGIAQEQRPAGMDNAVIYVKGGNYSPKFGAGYGVTLEMGSAAKSGPLKEGFAAGDIDVVTFTVYQSNDFSYTSNGRIPGQPVKGLQIVQAAGRLKGSFESSISGTLGKFQAKVEFDVPFPKQ